jgi:mannosyl-oligosaccharide alpha-1,2-mannosidase
MGATLVDSLDTALIMGFTEEFKEAVDHVKTMTFDSNWDGSTFETTIRYLGGLLAAHELSGEKVRKISQPSSWIRSYLLLDV